MRGFGGAVPDLAALKKPALPDSSAIKARFRYMFENEVYLRHKRQWLTIRDKQLPFLGRFIDCDRPGEKKDGGVLDGEAWRACLTFAGGMSSGLNPQSVQWFKLGFADGFLKADHQANVALDARMDVLTRALGGTNFYNATHNNYLELPFGQAALGIFADSARGLYFETYPIGSYAYEVDDRGMPAVFAVKKRMNARQIAARFGDGSLPDRVGNALKDNHGLDRRFDVCWLVESNPGADAGRLGGVYLPYVSYYWVEGCDGFLRTGGFEEFPVAVARYQVVGDAAYGIGPGWYADSDTRMLYAMLREGFANMELFTHPPVQAPSGVKVDYRPGVVTRNDHPAQSKVEALFNIAPVFDAVFEAAAQQRERINRAYSVNLFAMLDQAAMVKQGRTAYELALRNQEKMQQLGPVVERQNAEYLNVIIERSYAILERGGAFPPFADLESLDGEEIKIEYVSPMAQAQKISGIQNMESLLSLAGQVGQMFPDVADLIDWPEVIYTYADKSGAPAKLLKSREDFAREQAEKKEEALRDKQTQVALAGGKAAREYTGAAANIKDMGGGLMELLGQAGVMP